MNCTDTVQIILDKYLQFGWLELTTIFSSVSTVAKEKVLHRDVNERLLRLIGCVRTFVVDKTFECSKAAVSKDYPATYLAFGSTNITSDYDITIIGQKAPAIMMNMFNRFLDKYKNSLPFIFDTNVYCAGLYAKKHIHSLPQIVNVRGTAHCVLRANTQHDKAVQLQYAAIGLLESGMMETPRQPKLHALIQKARLLHSTLEDDIQKKIQQNTSKDLKKETKHMVAQYGLTYKNAQKLFRILYSKNTTHAHRLVMDLACKTQYYSIESYYTPGSFNIVVMNMQGGHSVGASKADYVCALLENLGHFRKHMHAAEGLSTAQLLLKNSKYIHRMYYAASHASRDKHMLKKTDTIAKMIVAKRGTPALANTLNFSVMGVTPSMKIETITNTITGMMLTIIESLLQ